MSDVRIRIASNTAGPCFQVLKEKGYRVSMVTYTINQVEAGYTYDYFAEKEDLFFSATNLEELLGIVCMWELRGNEWRSTSEEIKEFEKFRIESPLFDEDGNEVK